MRVALCYDHCAPHSVGGAERLYRALAHALAEHGHQVTYLTERCWDGPRETRDGPVTVVGVRDAPTSRGGDRRAVGPTVQWGAALARHMARHGDRYDVVHVSAFPAFAPLGARAGLAATAARRRPRLFVDWHEMWGRDGWRAYLPEPWWRAAARVERAAARVGEPVAFSRMHADRVGPGTPVIPEFLPAGDPGAPPAHQIREPLVVFLGRLITDKRPDVTVRALARMRQLDPAAGWRAVLFGDGPLRADLERLARSLGVADACRLPGFAPDDEVQATLRRASVMIHPTRREGFGIAVLEAAANGLPVVVCRARDNAAVELVSDRNGRVCDTANPEQVADAALDAAAEPGLSRRARDWYEQSPYQAGGCVAALEGLWATRPDVR